MITDKKRNDHRSSTNSETYIYTHIHDKHDKIYDLHNRHVLIINWYCPVFIHLDQVWLGKASGKQFFTLSSFQTDPYTHSISLPPKINSMFIIWVMFVRWLCYTPTATLTPFGTDDRSKKLSLGFPGYP